MASTDVLLRTRNWCQHHRMNNHTCPVELVGYYVAHMLGRIIVDKLHNSTHNYQVYLNVYSSGLQLILICFTLTGIKFVVHTNDFAPNTLPQSNIRTHDE